MTDAVPGPSLEAELRAEFAVREEPFSHGAFSVSVLLPRAAEDLIDESDFNVDERLPYWADLWPSARALARHLLDEPPPAGQVVELGCGVALPSLALRSVGASVTATDYYAEALRFARANAERNGLPPLPTAELDWREPPTIGPYDLVLAADVLYEMRNARSLAALLPRIVAPGGSVLLADPGRVYLADFRKMMLAAGWIAEAVTVRAERSLTATGEVVSKVGILRLTPPA
ncbi:MAG TPA: methyltransferase domain-containing protein [Longimicrobiaceae bacterium]|jgi:predicted nicotinamide N-methyase|nr:methyltransferase domain-containing protein [Longimicrobiaceae bacterium]